MFDHDSIDHDGSTSADTTTTTRSVSASNSELQEFREWRDAKLQRAAYEQGRAVASAASEAEEAAADNAAIQQLASKGLKLSDCFGSRSSVRGRDQLTIIHRKAFSSKADTYSRLRRLAKAQGLVTH